MRRFVSVFCLMIVFISSLVVPVKATVLDKPGWFNVLDIANAQCDTGTILGPSYIARVAGRNTDTISFPLPQYTDCVYVDILFRSDSSSPGISFGGESIPITLISDDDYKLYRAYGMVYFYVDVLSFDYTWSGGWWLDILSFNVCTTEPNGTDIEAYCELNAAPDYQRTIHYVPGDEINHRIIESTNTIADTYLLSYIWTDEWRKYDIIDFQLMYDIFDITSVTAVMGNTNVPLEVSYVKGTSIEGNTFYCSFSMDVSGLDKSSSDYPMIIVYGRLDLATLNSVDFVNCSGRVIGTDLNPLTYFLKSINSRLTSILQVVNVHSSNLRSWISSQTDAIVSAIRGDTAPGNDFQDQVSDKDSELKDMAAVMDSVTKPDLNDISVEVNDYVDPNILASSMSGISSVAASPIFSDVLLMAIILATAGYVLYGKR